MIDHNNSPFLSKGLSPKNMNTVSDIANGIRGGKKFKGASRARQWARAKTDLRGLPGKSAMSDDYHRAMNRAVTRKKKRELP